MRPMEKGWCRYESLKDGTLDLFDVAKMNDLLLMNADNEEIAEDLRKSRKADND
jgi:hypothetical protein